MKCLVTGFTGIATGEAKYLNGCIQYLISPPMKKNGEFVEGRWIDSQQLKVVGIGIIFDSKDTGGPVDNPPKGQPHP